MRYSETLMWKEISETPKVFGEIQSVNTEIMNKLVADIKSSGISNFVAAARGSSDNALTYFKYVLEVNTHYTVGLSAPSVITLYRGKINYSNSIVIGCSQNGDEEDVLEVIKKGNEQGAITIAVTNNLNSPMAKQAKYHLFLNAGVENGVATKTFSAQLFVLLWLASELSQNKENLLLLKNLKREIEKVIPEIDVLTTKYADKFKDMQSGFALSRGLTYAVALETALKFQETCFIQMKGYAGSDFYYGPMAIVNENTPVMVFAAKNNGDQELQSLVRSDQIKCVEKMLKLKAPVLLVTNDCVLTGKFVKCNDALINFGVSEEVCMFAFAIFAQMLTCKIAYSKVETPDELGFII